MQLHTARIFVQDLTLAARFYEEILGLPLKADGRDQGFCVFDAGPMSLVVESVEADAPAEDQALVAASQACLSTWKISSQSTPNSRHAASPSAASPSLSHGAASSPHCATPPATSFNWCSSPERSHWCTVVIQ